MQFDPSIAIQISLVLGMIGLFFTIFNLIKRIEDKFDQKFDSLEKKLNERMDKFELEIKEMKTRLSSVELLLARLQSQNEFLIREVSNIREQLFVPRFPRQINDNAA